MANCTLHEHVSDDGRRTVWCPTHGTGAVNLAPAEEWDCPEGGPDMKPEQMVAFAAGREIGREDAGPKPMSDVDIRVHAINLAVVGRKDSIRFVEKDYQDEFADQCLADALKFEAYIRGGSDGA